MITLSKKISQKINCLGMNKQFVTNVTILVYVASLLGVSGVYINDLKNKNLDLKKKNEILTEDKNFLVDTIEYKDNLILDIEKDFKTKEEQLNTQIEELKNQLVEKQNQIDELSNTVNDLDSQLKKKRTIDNTTTNSLSTDSPSNGIPLGEFKVTFYAPTDGSVTGTTATGNKAIPYHTVAVDPNVIPLGTKLYIEGFGEAIADDVGGAIKGNILDYCVSSSSEAYSYGIKYLNVWIME